MMALRVRLWFLKEEWDKWNGGRICDLPGVLSQISLPSDDSLFGAIHTCRTPGRSIRDGVNFF